MCNLKHVSLMLVLGFILAACGNAEQQVKQAAQQRWAALIKGDLAQAYQAYTQAFQATTSLAAFKQHMRGTGLWQTAEVKNVHCDSTLKQCKVEVEVTMAMRMRGVAEPVETSDSIEETWINEGWLADWRYIK